ncbi:MAG: hypothetical protein R3F54_15260 [Alphaproteobacteria bacterium]
MAIVTTIWLGDLMAQTVEVESSKPIRSEPSTPHGRHQIDRAQERISQAVRTTGEWLDSFFEDERYTEEVNRSRVGIGTSAFFDIEGSSDVSYRFTTRILLPNTKRRLSLFAGGVINEEDEDGNLLPDNDLDDDNLSDDDDGLGIGAQYSLLQRLERNLSLRSTVLWRRDQPVLSIGPRYRETVPLDESWDLRLTNTIRYFTDDGWFWRGILDLERPIQNDALLRIGPSATWKQDDSGVEYEANVSLFTPLGRNRVVEYQFNNLFETEAPNRHVETNLRVRYRRQIWREWLKLEVAPEIALLRDAEWEVTPGILLRLELLFGGSSPSN